MVGRRAIGRLTSEGRRGRIADFRRVKSMSYGASFTQVDCRRITGGGFIEGQIGDRVQSLNQRSVGNRTGRIRCILIMGQNLFRGEFSLVQGKFIHPAEVGV